MGDLPRSGGVGVDHTPQFDPFQADESSQKPSVYQHRAVEPRSIPATIGFKSDKSLKSSGSEVQSRAVGKLSPDRSRAFLQPKPASSNGNSSILSSYLSPKKKERNTALPEDVLQVVFPFYKEVSVPSVLKTPSSEIKELLIALKNMMECGEPKAEIVSLKQRICNGCVDEIRENLYAAKEIVQADIKAYQMDEENIQKTLDEERINQLEKHMKELEGYAKANERLTEELHNINTFLYGAGTPSVQVVERNELGAETGRYIGTRAPDEIDRATDLMAELEDEIDQNKATIKKYKKYLADFSKELFIAKERVRLLGGSGDEKATAITQARENIKYNIQECNRYISELKTENSQRRQRVSEQGNAIKELKKNKYREKIRDSGRKKSAKEVTADLEADIKKNNKIIGQYKEYIIQLNNDEMAASGKRFVVAPFNRRKTEVLKVKLKIINNRQKSYKEDIQALRKENAGLSEVLSKHLDKITTSKERINKIQMSVQKQAEQRGMSPHTELENVEKTLNDIKSGREAGVRDVFSDKVRASSAKKYHKEMKKKKMIEARNEMRIFERFARGWMPL